MAMQQPYTLMDSIDVAGLLPSGSKGPVYVLQSDINSSGSHIAVSLSDQSIQVFSVAGGAGGSRGVSVSHSRSINARSRSGRKKTEDDIASSHRISDIQFSPADPHVLYSCSTDCHVTVWDTRTSRSSASWRVGSDAQALAATANGRGLAVATEAPVGSVDDAPLISLWDLRAQNRLHLYEGIHSEPISQLSWHPNKPQMLLSTAEDGLLCALDATASDPDDALGWCCNFETPVRSFGFFGPGSQHACALTCNESVQLCRLGEDVLQVSAFQFHACGLLLWTLSRWVTLLGGNTPTRLLPLESVFYSRQWLCDALGLRGCSRSCARRHFPMFDKSSKL